MTKEGGTGYVGTIFRIDRSGLLTTIHTFTGDEVDGALPVARLIQGSDGSFYGTTPGFGSSNRGRVFRVDTAGSLTTLNTFTGSDGGYPVAGLVQSSDGSFYGTTSGFDMAESGNGAIPSAETGTVAPRTCFFLHLIGHPRTAVLHGGLRDWKGIGGQVEKGAVKPTPAARFRPRLNREAIATVDDVVAGITRNDTIVLDVRSNDEYEGRLNDASGCEECDRLGHIPGSVWVEFSELTEGRYRIKPWQEVQARLAQAGVTPDKTLIPY